VSRPLVRWVEPPGDGERLGELVQRLGAAGDGALAEGRVFVDGRRETLSDLAVAAGCVVEVHAGRAAATGVAILAEHRGLVFVSKPPGVATEPDHSGIAGSLVAQTAELLSLPAGALHAVSRLDVGVSGVVTLARDAAAVELAGELRARGGFVRRYLALAARAPEPGEGSWTWPVPRHLRAHTHSAEGERAAETRYASVALAGPVFLPGRAAARLATRPALLALSPVTGRTHQLRLHATRAGTPLLGDAAHGGPQRVILSSGSVRALERVGLHAAWVELELGAEKLRVAAPPPEDLLALWADLGGAAEDWPRALEIALPPARG